MTVDRQYRPRLAIRWADGKRDEIPLTAWATETEAVTEYHRAHIALQRHGAERAVIIQNLLIRLDQATLVQVFLDDRAAPSSTDAGEAGA